MTPPLAPARPDHFTISSHASRRMDQMGLHSREVLTAATDPTLATWPAGLGRHDGGRVHVRGRLAVIVNPDDGTILTVLWHLASRPAVRWAAPTMQVAS